MFCNSLSLSLMPCLKTHLPSVSDSQRTYFWNWEVIRRYHLLLIGSPMEEHLIFGNLALLHVGFCFLPGISYLSEGFPYMPCSDAGRSNCRWRIPIQFFWLHIFFFGWSIAVRIFPSYPIWRILEREAPAWGSGAEWSSESRAMGMVAHTRAGVFGQWVEWAMRWGKGEPRTKNKNRKKKSQTKMLKL